MSFYKRWYDDNMSYCRICDKCGRLIIPKFMERSNIYEWRGVSFGRLTSETPLELESATETYDLCETCYNDLKSSIEAFYEKWLESLNDR